MNTYLGIDISKKFFDVTLLISDKPVSKKFSNNDRGFKDLVIWLDKQSINDLHACLEATGFYGEALAEFLFERKYSVSIVNPLCIKHYAQSRLKRHKTDKIDSVLIAEYCKIHKPALWKMPSADLKKLRELSRCLEDLKVQLGQVNNHLERKLKSSKIVTTTWTELKTKIENQIKKIYVEIDNLFKSNEDLGTKCKNLKTIPGIGKKTAITLLAEIPDIDSFKNSRQLVAFAGLVPSQKFSGSSVKGRSKLSKMGSLHLRKALFFPAIVARKFNSIIKDFCKRLEQKRKHSFVIIGAAMHKLLSIVFAVLKNNTEFKENVIIKN
jgi:transposase